MVPFGKLTNPRKVDLAGIEEALALLSLVDADEYADDCSDSASGPHDSITRACMSNLVVYCDDLEQAQKLPAEFATISRRHPARVILLLIDDSEASREIEARVSAQIFDDDGCRQVCSEQIDIRAPISESQRLPSAARRLLIGDLPTALWWNSLQPPPSGGTLFKELAGMADSVVYDSRGWADPRAGVMATASWVGTAESELLIADLAWLRLHFWRQLIAEALAPQVLPGALDRVARLELEHGPHALPMMSLLVGWLADSLGWTPTGGSLISGKEHSLRFRTSGNDVDVVIRRDDDGPPELRHLKLQARSAVGTGADLEAEFEAVDKSRLAVRISAGSRSEHIVSAPDEPRVAMLAAQLSNRAGQPHFRSALAMASSMVRELGG
jgi:glucose-6-phosphate dehydrogenase assembly protein OpcA